MPPETTPDQQRPLTELTTEELTAFASSKLAEIIAAAEATDKDKREPAPPDPMIRDLLRELRHKATALYKSNDPTYQALFDLARTLETNTTVRNWNSTHTPILQHRFPEPMTHEDNPFGLSSVMIGVRQLVLNETPILATGGMRFGLERINPADTRIARLKPADLLSTLPSSLGPIRDDDFVPERKHRAIMRRVRELAEILRMDAVRIGCNEQDARTFVDEWPLTMDSPKWNCFSGTDSSGAETALSNALTSRQSPSELIKVVEANVSGILNAINNRDTGPYGAYCVGSVRDGGRRSKR